MSGPRCLRKLTHSRLGGAAPLLALALALCCSHAAASRSLFAPIQLQNLTSTASPPPTATTKGPITTSASGTAPVLPAGTLTPIVVSSNSSAGAPWRSASYGCNDCNFTDVTRRRPSDASSIFASMDPWAALILESSSPFNGNSVLDMWVKGAGVARVVLYLHDTRQRRLSNEVQFSRLDAASVVQQGVTVLGADDDGWIRIQISLAALATLPGTSITQVADLSGWDRIVVRDVSGSGFQLQLSSPRLVALGLSAAAWDDDLISSLGPQLSTPVASLKLPVINIDTPQAGTRSTANRYIMKLKPGTATMGTLKNICQELAGALPQGTSRFRGACDATTLPAVFDLQQPDSTPLGWAFATFTVSSQGDLDAMRSSLGASLEYLERDMVASIGHTVHEGEQEPAAAATTATNNRFSAAAASTPGADEGKLVGSIQIEPSAQEPHNATTAPGNGTSTAAPSPSPSRSPSPSPLRSPSPSPSPSRSPSPSPSRSPSPSPSPSRPPSPSPSRSPAPVGGKNVTDTNSTKTNSTRPPSCMCYALYMPVCGSDGKTYPNACEAWCAGLLTWAPGACGGGGWPDVGSGLGGGFGAAETVDTSPRSWGLDRLDQVYLPLDGAYRPGPLDGTGSHVYILDTGVRTTHVAFSGRVGEGTSMLGGGYGDDNGHGTHVAATAMGATYGVARNAVLHPVKVLDASGSGSYSDFIAALGWVKNHVQRNGIRQAVVSMSLAGPRGAALNDAIADLTNNGVAVVVAAGNNNGGDSCSYSPASAPSAITVGSSNRDDTLSSFSNVGGCVFTFAPGANIVSASYSSDYAEVGMSGTSMATPHVTGVVALLFQAYPGASVSYIKERLAAAAAPITLTSSSPSRLLNAQSSRLAPASSTPTTTTPSSPTTTPSTPTTTTPSPSTGITLPGFNWPGTITFPWSTNPTTPTTNPTPAPSPSPTPAPAPTVTKPSWCSMCAWCNLMGC